MKYVIAQEATQDLEDILDYFLSRNIDAGERFAQEFNRKCQYLTQFPNIGKSYSSLALTDSVVIVRVISGYRDLKSIFTDTNS